jgi:multidrug efflux pump
MQLAEVSIRRPVFATVHVAADSAGWHAVCFDRLTVREYPKIDEPVVTVTVRYPGASAEVVESQISKPLEDSIAGIDAVDVITSISRADQSQFRCGFALKKTPMPLPPRCVTAQPVFATACPPPLKSPSLPRWRPMLSR